LSGTQDTDQRGEDSYAVLITNGILHTPLAGGKSGNKATRDEPVRSLQIANLPLSLCLFEDKVKAEH
jgi:hypothetical protein